MGIEKEQYLDERHKSPSALGQGPIQDDLLKNLNFAENYEENLLTAMEEDIHQLNKEELESFLAMLKNLNASRRSDPEAEHLSFRDWIHENAEIYPDTSEFFEQIDKSPSPKLIKELTAMAQEQFDTYFAEEGFDY